MANNVSSMPLWEHLHLQWCFGRWAQYLRYYCSRVSGALVDGMGGDGSNAVTIDED